MNIFGVKKRTFDISARLHPRQTKGWRIEFDRLPRKKMRSVWWYFLLFALCFALYYYLNGRLAGY